MLGRAVALGAVAGFAMAAVAWAQEDGRDAERRAAEQAGLYAPSLWDLELGAHATELNRREFMDYACGTNGGPPSLPVDDWTQYAMCPAEADTGFHEVYFQYDDELEYWAKSQSLPNKISLYEFTSAYADPDHSERVIRRTRASCAGFGSLPIHACPSPCARRGSTSAAT